jgi:hypothetical protein
MLALTACSAVRGSKTAVGLSALCAVLFTHSFWFAKNATHFLYRKHKTVVNNGTLYAILAELIGNI